MTFASSRASDSSLELGWGEFDGRRAFLEAANDGAWKAIGNGDFTLALWAHTAPGADDAGGDLASCYDAAARRGFNLTLQHQSATCTSMANTRNVFFGIDNGTRPRWTDRGRPGNNLMVFALAVFEGDLYAGTFEAGETEAGHVYRHRGGQAWEDLGSPDACNAVSALGVFEGSLFAGVSQYNAAGSALVPSPNLAPGGKVYRYAGGTNWIDCGRPSGAGVIWGMTVYQGALHVTSMDAPPKNPPTQDQGLYRYEGGRRWTYRGNPGGRVAAIAPHDGALFATGFDGGAKGGLFRCGSDGRWTNFGAPPRVDQTYSIAVRRGQLHTGTWKEGKVYRYLGSNEWEDAGRLGQELEVMGLTVYHGQLYGGTLPLAEVYRYDGGEAWTSTGRLDFSDGKYRRAWSMAVFQGQLFCGTLPSGRVHALQAGAAVSHDAELKPGWRHIAALRRGARLELFIDGQLAGESLIEDPTVSFGAEEAPLRIGFGEQDYFKGRLRDIRVYRGALPASEIKVLARAAD